MTLALPQINLIFACASNGVIGNNNTIPWHVPEDLARFKTLTMGCPVIMGRKTWDSLPPRFRPLPGRTNIVLTRQTHWHAEGAHSASSLAQALALCGQATDVWIMGGAQIYAQALPLARRVEITKIEKDFEGNAFAPVLDDSWQQTASESGQSAQGLRFKFISFQRKPKITENNK